jgi:hypothetical protein
LSEPVATLALVACLLWAGILLFYLLTNLLFVLVRGRVDLLSTGDLVSFAVRGALGAGFVSLSAMLMRYLRRRELLIGTDGIALGKRFIAHRDIAAVTRTGWGQELTLHDGTTVALPVRRRRKPALDDAPPAPGSGDALDHELREALGARLAAARAGSASSLESRTLEALERRGLPFDAWRARLRGLLEREPTYRTTTVDTAALRRIVADAAAPIEPRVAAALVLSDSTAAEDRRGLRVAIEASADTELRALLEAAAAGEIEEERMLRALAARRP